MPERHLAAREAAADGADHAVAAHHDGHGPGRSGFIGEPAGVLQALGHDELELGTGGTQRRLGSRQPAARSAAAGRGVDEEQVAMGVH